MAASRTQPKYHPIFNPRPTKKNVLLTEVYNAIRDHQDGKLTGCTVVGRLNLEGTALYDRIQKAVEKAL